MGNRWLALDVARRPWLTRVFRRGGLVCEIAGNGLTGEMTRATSMQLRRGGRQVSTAARNRVIPASSA